MMRKKIIRNGETMNSNNKQKQLTALIAIMGVLTAVLFVSVIILIAAAA